MKTHNQTAVSATPPPTTWNDIASSLVWPMLLRAPRLALRPARILIALFTIVVVALVNQLPRLWSPDSPGAIGTLTERIAWLPRALIDGWGAQGAPGVLGALANLTLSTPLELIREQPIGTLLALFLALPVWALGTLAVSRSAAVELSGGVPLPWPRALGFARERIMGGFGVIFTPWALLWVTAALIASLGWLMLRVPWLQVLGAAFFIVLLLLAAVTVFLLVCALAGTPLFIPALATEATDSLDAMQRTGAYVTAHPVRFIGYLLLAVGIGVLAIGVAGLIQQGVQWFAFSLSMAWLPAEFSAAVLGQSAGESGTSIQIAARLVGFWLNLPTYLFLGYSLSYFCCAGTAMYMALRRVCDGQDTSEIWVPGTTPGTATRADILAAPAEGDTQE
jgi:hypothetical protein